MPSLAPLRSDFTRRALWSLQTCGTRKAFTASLSSLSSLAKRSLWSLWSLWSRRPSQPRTPLNAAQNLQYRVRTLQHFLGLEDNRQRIIRRDEGYPVIGNASINPVADEFSNIEIHPLQRISDFGTGISRTSFRILEQCGRDRITQERLFPRLFNRKNLHCTGRQNAIDENRERCFCDA